MATLHVILPSRLVAETIVIISLKIDYKMLIRAIFQNNVLNEDGKIFLESSKHTSFELSKTQNILKDKTIGDVRLIILQ